MSFERAMREVEAIERQALELERQSKGKDVELARLNGQFDTAKADSPETLTGVIQALEGSDNLGLLTAFVDQHQSVETGMNLGKCFPREAVQGLVNTVAKRLQRGDHSDPALLETLRLARGMLRESREVASALVNDAFALFVLRITRKHAPAVRDAALKCFQICIAQNIKLRNALIENEQAIDRLTLAAEEMAAIIRDPDLSSNIESARIVVTLKNLFDGSAGQEDKIIARMLIKSGVVSANVERMAKAFMEIADMPSKSLIESSNALVSTTYEGISRGTVLIDGFRFMYVVAVFADEDLLQAMLQNDSKPTLSGEDLERCDLSNPNLGMGDRYVFLQTHVMLANVPPTAPKKDQDNFDKIKCSLCSTLAFADRAPGFVAYLYRHGVGRALFELLDRETTRAKLPGGTEEGLLNILIAIKVLVDNNDDVKENFQDMFFERILPELDPADFNTEEEFMQAKEKRHYAGRSIPETTFGKVVQLLTSFDDHVKRFAGELLYTLCDEDSNKVVHFVGFGHAAHLLAIKGGMLGQIGATNE
jgi:hypothetical protein